MRLPVFRQLFSSNDTRTTQTDIVMLITPHIVRTQELRGQDVNPIYIGTQQNLGLGGPPPLISPPPPEAAAQPAAPSPVPEDTGPGPEQPGVTPGTLPKPGVLPVPAPAPPQPQPAPETPAPAPGETAPEAQGGVTGCATPPVSETAAPVVVPRDRTGETAAATESSTAGSVAQVTITAPGTEFKVGGGPYTVPLSISGASRVSTLSLSVTFDPAVLRVRAVQEGSFMRQGGVSATFTHQVDAAGGRIDMSLTRAQDLIGASGSGLLAAIVFEPIAAGSATLAASGAGAGPAGSTVTIQSAPVSITVR
jgi:hypothetical protein